MSITSAACERTSLTISTIHCHYQQPVSDMGVANGIMNEAALVGRLMERLSWDIVIGDEKIVFAGLLRTMDKNAFKAAPK